MSALKNSLREKKATAKDADDEMQEDEATEGKEAPPLQEIHDIQRAVAARTLEAKWPAVATHPCKR
jgi:hypothetical protein